jgi:hypothetical protein
VLSEANVTAPNPPVFIGVHLRLKTERRKSCTDPSSARNAVEGKISPPETCYNPLLLPTTSYNRCLAPGVAPNRLSLQPRVFVVFVGGERFEKPTNPTKPTKSTKAPNH